MTTLLGLDLGADALDVFGGDLFRGTLHKRTPGTYTAGDPASGTNATTADYVCDAYAFGYKERFVDGEHIKKGDYRVVILRTSISTANPAVRAGLRLGSVTPDDDTVVEAKLAGAVGNLISVALVGDAGAQAGSIAEAGTAVTIHFLPGSTTVLDVEVLIATSTLIQTRTVGTPGNVLQVGDALAPTRLAGGVDASLTPVNVLPNPGDTIDVPPPGQTTAKTGRVVNIEALTEAQVTCQTRGVGA